MKVNRIEYLINKHDVKDVLFLVMGNIYKHYFTSIFIFIVGFGLVLNYIITYLYGIHIIHPILFILLIYPTILSLEEFFHCLMCLSLNRPEYIHSCAIFNLETKKGQSIAMLGAAIRLRIKDPAHIVMVSLSGPFMVFMLGILLLLFNALIKKTSNIWIPNIYIFIYFLFPLLSLIPTKGGYPSDGYRIVKSIINLKCGLWYLVIFCYSVFYLNLTYLVRILVGSNNKR